LEEQAEGHQDHQLAAPGARDQGVLVEKHLYGSSAEISDSMPKRIAEVLKIKGEIIKCKSNSVTLWICMICFTTSCLFWWKI
jgi:hypothetical protein